MKRFPVVMLQTYSPASRSYDTVSDNSSHRQWITC